MTSNWNDLQFFLAIHESGSLASAARKLKVDETTVGRRLAALESDLGSKLFERKRQGYVTTPAGIKVLEAALPIRARLMSLQTKIEGGDQSFKGTVKLTMPETISVHLVMPKLPELLSLYPELEIQFLTSAQTVNISKREADIAIRMFKPKQNTLYAKKLGKLRFAFYTSLGYVKLHGMPEDGNLKQHTLIDYPDSEATDDEADLLKNLRAKHAHRVQVNNRYSMLAGIQAGLGMGMIPEIMADAYPELIQVMAIKPLDLDMWMVVHSDLKKNARVRASADFLSAVIAPRLK